MQLTKKMTTVKSHHFLTSLIVIRNSFLKFLWEQQENDRVMKGEDAAGVMKQVDKIYSILNFSNLSLVASTPLTIIIWNLFQSPVCFDPPSPPPFILSMSRTIR